MLNRIGRKNIEIHIQVLLYESLCFFFSWIIVYLGTSVATTTKIFTL